MLDFDIFPYGNPKILTFIDRSIYTGLTDSPVLDITFPGHTEVKTINIIPSQLNNFNSYVLGLTCTSGDEADLPDGLYCLTYRVKPYDILSKTKLHLRTTVLEYQYENFLIKLDLSDTATINVEYTKKELLKFNTLISAAQAHANKNNTRKASEYYNMAKIILNNLSKKDR